MASSDTSYHHHDGNKGAYAWTKVLTVYRLREMTYMDGEAHGRGGGDLGKDFSFSEGRHGGGMEIMWRDAELDG